MVPAPYLAEVQLKREGLASTHQYPFSLPAVRNLKTLKIHPKVTFLVGENGSGKSTLLEAIAVALRFNPEGGSLNLRFETRPSHSSLHQHLKLIRSIRRPRDGFFLRAESFYNVATELEKLSALGSYGGKSLHEQSHGEAFLNLMIHRFGGKGIYLLDEPEAALSPQRQLAMLTRLHTLVLDDSQFVIATHSPILMAYPDAWIYSFTEKGIRKVAYEETEHYRITHSFLSNPRRMLDILMEPDPDTSSSADSGTGS
jgi:predicted ATPase